MTTPAADAPLLPVAVRTVRYHCPSCGRGHGKKPAAVAHIARCWRNPGNRACHTCKHYVPPNCEPEVGINDDEYCDSDGDLTGGIVTGCPYWEPNALTTIREAGRA